MTATKVNPPPTLRVPKAFIVDPEIRAFIEQQNTIIFQLWNRSGGNVDIIDEVVEDESQNRIDIDINTGNITDNNAAIGVNSAAIIVNTAAIIANTDDITELENLSHSGFLARIEHIQRQLNGLPELTIDTTGFTVDTTLITTDKVIA